MAEIPPKANPFANAYKGAVIGAHVLLNIVIKANTKPITDPPIVNAPIEFDPEKY